jgi:hypothetical protein
MMNLYFDLLDHAFLPNIFRIKSKIFFKLIHTKLLLKIVLPNKEEKTKNKAPKEIDIMSKKTNHTNARTLKYTYSHY